MLKKYYWLLKLWRLYIDKFTGNITVILARKVQSEIPVPGGILEYVIIS